MSDAPWDLSLCDFRKQEQPPGFEGWVSSVAFSDDGPLVAVVPFGNGGMDLAGQGELGVPRVLGIENGRWKPVSWGPTPPVDPRAKDFSSRLKAQTDALICTGPKRSIWLASWNTYRLEEVSSFQKPKREIVVGNGKVKWEEWSKEEQAKNVEMAKRRGLDPSENAAHAYAQNILRAIVNGRDGMIYLLVSVGEGLALDRFDPSTEALDRVLLEGVQGSRGPMTAAFGSDELVFGGRLAADGLWKVSRERLATARWKPVLEVTIDGKPTKP